MNRPICQCWTLKIIFSPIKNAVLIYKAINYQAFIAITHNISFSISFKNTTAPAITQMQKRLAFVPTLMFYTSRRLLKFLAIFHSCFLGVKPRQWNANLCYVVCLFKQTKKGFAPSFPNIPSVAMMLRCSGAYRSIFTFSQHAKRLWSVSEAALLPAPLEINTGSISRPHRS